MRKSSDVLSVCCVLLSHLKEAAVGHVEAVEGSSRHQSLGHARRPDEAVAALNRPRGAVQHLHPRGEQRSVAPTEKGVKMTAVRSEPHDRSRREDALHFAHKVPLSAHQRMLTCFMTTHCTSAKRLNSASMTPSSQSGPKPCTYLEEDGDKTVVSGGRMSNGWCRWHQRRRRCWCWCWCWCWLLMHDALTATMGS